MINHILPTCGQLTLWSLLQTMPWPSISSQINLERAKNVKTSRTQGRAPHLFVEPFTFAIKCSERFRRWTSVQLWSKLGTRTLFTCFKFPIVDTTNLSHKSLFNTFGWWHKFSKRGHRWNKVRNWWLVVREFSEVKAVLRKTGKIPDSFCLRWFSFFTFQKGCWSLNNQSKSHKLWAEPMCSSTFMFKDQQKITLHAVCCDCIITSQSWYGHSSKGAISSNVITVRCREKSLWVSVWWIVVTHTPNYLPAPHCNQIYECPWTSVPRLPLRTLEVERPPRFPNRRG